MPQVELISAAWEKAQFRNLDEVTGKNPAQEQYSTISQYFTNSPQFGTIAKRPTDLP